MDMDGDILNIIDNDDLLVSVLRRDSNTVTFCFSGIGGAIGGINIQSFEFSKSSQNSTTIFIVDRKRSWGNNIDFAQIVESTKEFTRGKTVNAIGNSMGGFLAVLLTKFTNVASCVAFVPQYSVSRNVIPSENRFTDFTNNIKKWNYESLNNCFNQKTKYYIFFGADNSIEDEHRNLFPNQNNISVFTFLDMSWSHAVAQYLKDANCLYPTLQSCFNQVKPEVVLSQNLSAFNIALR
jgi:hypothetical protein